MRQFQDYLRRLCYSHAPCLLICYCHGYFYVLYYASTMSRFPLCLIFSTLLPRAGLTWLNFFLEFKKNCETEAFSFYDLIVLLLGYPTSDPHLMCMCLCDLHILSFRLEEKLANVESENKVLRQQAVSMAPSKILSGRSKSNLQVSVAMFCIFFYFRRYKWVLLFFNQLFCNPCLFYRGVPKMFKYQATIQK